MHESHVNRAQVAVLAADLDQWRGGMLGSLRRRETLDTIVSLVVHDSSVMDLMCGRMLSLIPWSLLGLHHASTGRSKQRLYGRNRRFRGEGVFF